MKYNYKISATAVAVISLILFVSGMNLKTKTSSRIREQALAEFRNNPEINFSERTDELFKEEKIKIWVWDIMRYCGFLTLISVPSFIVRKGKLNRK